MADRDRSQELRIVVRGPPRGAVHLVDHDGRVQLDLGRGDAALQGRRVDDRLERRTGLPERLRGPVELGVVVVPASHQSPHVAGAGVGGHEHPLHVRNLPEVHALRRVGELPVLHVVEPGPRFDPVPAVRHRRLGRGLHVQVQGRADLQSGGVQLAAEAVVQDAPHPFHEVRRLLLDGARPLERHGLLLPARSVVVGQVALARHQVQDQVPSAHGGFRVAKRRIVLGQVGDRRQQGALGRVHVDGVLAEVVLGGSLKSIPAMGIADLVHVSLEDLFLGVRPLQGRGDLPLLQLPKDALLEAQPLRPHVAGQLLRDRAAAAPGERPGSDHAQHGARDSPGVQSPVLIEPLVLDRDERLGHVGRKARKRHQRAALRADLGHQPSVAGVDLAGLARLVGVDASDRRAVRAQVPPCARRQSRAAREKEQQHEPHAGGNPQSAASPAPAASAAPCVRERRHSSLHWVAPVCRWRPSDPGPHQVTTNGAAGAGTGVAGRG